MINNKELFNKINYRHGIRVCGDLNCEDCESITEEDLKECGERVSLVHLAQHIMSDAIYMDTIKANEKELSKEAALAIYQQGLTVIDIMVRRSYYDQDMEEQIAIIKDHVDKAYMGMIAIGDTLDDILPLLVRLEIAALTIDYQFLADEKPKKIKVEEPVRPKIYI